MGGAEQDYFEGSYSQKAEKGGEHPMPSTTTPYAAPGINTGHKKQPPAKILERDDGKGRIRC